MVLCLFWTRFCVTPATCYNDKLSSRNQWYGYGNFRLKIIPNEQWRVHLIREMRALDEAPIYLALPATMADTGDSEPSDFIAGLASQSHILTSRLEGRYMEWTASEAYTCHAFSLRRSPVLQASNFGTSRTSSIASRRSTYLVSLLPMSRWYAVKLWLDSCFKLEVNRGKNPHLYISSTGPNLWALSVSQSVKRLN